MTKENIYDVIILGAGPGGLTAAMYAGRSGLKTLVLDKMPMPGGTMVNVPVIENWPGTLTISGQELSNNMAEHAKKSGAELKQFAELVSVDLSDKVKKIKTTAGEFETYSLVIATGAIHAHLGVPGEKELESMGVSYCAPCDAPLFKEKNVVVVGGGNSALSQALFIAKIVKSVTLIHRRDSFRAEQALIDQVKAEKKISFLLNHVVIEILGEGMVSGVRTKDIHNDKEQVLSVSGVFIYVGLNPNTSAFGKWLGLDELGCIIVDDSMATSVPGVFAIGDARITPLRQIITAAGDGAIAAMSAGKYLREVK